MSPSQSMLDAAGPQAATIEWVWWVFFWVSAFVYAVVMAATLWGVLRRDQNRDVHDRAAARRAGLVITAAGATTVLLLFGLLIASVSAGRRLQQLAHPEHVPIIVTGQQWWWSVEYESDVPARRVVTANEIRIPIGRPVLLRLRSVDVIHSFYVPSLHGTRDLIPGHETTSWLQADRPGVFRGQCAEFCGHQHAHMGIVVIAEPQEKFDEWLAAERSPAAEPQTEQEHRGRELFLSGPCVMCHAVRGTPAGGRTGPDLTHVASRMTIASGTLSNTREHLESWVRDSQRIKPGNRMPSMALPDEDLRDIVSYLRRLK
jgi:cytochrome c oxidase subunit 2